MNYTGPILKDSLKYCISQGNITFCSIQILIKLSMFINLANVYHYQRWKHVKHFENLMGYKRYRARKFLREK